jgi:hypothetical protein
VVLNSLPLVSVVMVRLLSSGARYGSDLLTQFILQTRRISY